MINYMFARVVRHLSRKTISWPYCTGPTAGRQTGCSHPWVDGERERTTGGLGWAWKGTRGMPRRGTRPTPSGGWRQWHALSCLLSQNRVDCTTFKGEKMQVDCSWLHDSTNFTGLFGVGMENTGGSNEYLKVPTLKISKIINHSSQHQLL